MKRAVSLLALLLAAACSSTSTQNADDASSSASTTNSRVKIDIVQLSEPSAVQAQAPVDVQLGVGVDNISNETVTIRRVEIQQVGRGAWVLQPGAQRSFTYNQPVAAGATDEVKFWVHAYALTPRGNMGDTEPVTLRVIVFFDAASGNFREVRQKMLGQF